MRTDDVPGTTDAAVQAHGRFFAWLDASPETPVDVRRLTEEEHELLQSVHHRLAGLYAASLRWRPRGHRACVVSRETEGALTS